MTRQYGIPSRSDPAAPTRGERMALQLLHDEAARRDRRLMLGVVALFSLAAAGVIFGLLRIGGVIG